MKKKPKGPVVFSTKSKHIMDYRYDVMRAKCLADMHEQFTRNKQMPEGRLRALLHGCDTDFTDKEQANLLSIWAAREADHLKALENYTMLPFAKGQLLTQWLMSIPGIGAITAVKTYGYFDCTTCCCPQFVNDPTLHDPKRPVWRIDWPEHECPGTPTVGHWWRFAGLDPTVPKHQKGEIRHYSTPRKCFWYKTCESWEKGASTPYGILLHKFKEEEEKKNSAGKNAAEAQRRLLGKHGAHAGRASIVAWKKGELPDFAVRLRAFRRVSKIFLSHYFQVAREVMGYETVKPWVFVHADPVHTHYIAPFNWPFTFQEPKPRRNRKVAF